MGLPTPAIIFMAVIGGFCFLLLILYQCLKAGMFFKTEPPERPNEKDYVELGETYESDDEFIGPSSKATSRRSSFNTSGSKSDGELALGDSASVYGYPKSSDGEYSPAGPRRALSAYGEAIDLRSGHDELVSTAGRIQVSASYAPTAEKLAVNVIRAEDVPSKQRGGAANVQVRVVLLPSKRQRFKTKAKPSANPNFHENFTFSRVTQGEIHDCGLRFRLYGHERVGRDKLIGEVNISLTEFDLDGDGTPLWRTLTPRSSLSGSDSMYDLSDTASVRSFGSSSSLAMAQGGVPELLVSLCYQSLTGRLTVEVLKASNLRNVSMQRAPDSYVKVTLVSTTGKQVAKSKTTIRKSMADPEYNESFVYEISENDLHTSTLMFSVIAISKTRKKKEMIGWFALGKNHSGEEEIRHWNDMIQQKEQKISQWHLLSDS